ncbi:sensor histidine kinase [Spirosoma oryzicola]|uniref:sensor histidine kinase n=1 Tax=Spirosoma oryzicola TaxID=2898794 RepID=UPI001E4E344F|nr:histidine kinase [Spirosoma oryzicola]UHG91203.1 histidine kinase [Spirosoma oryzicola]
MESTLKTSPLKSGYWSAFANWFQQTGQPLIARWWIWVVLIISISYLTYQFNQTSLEDQLTEYVTKAEKRDLELAKEGGRWASSSYRTGAFAGRIVRSFADNSGVWVAFVVLLFAVIRIQYEYIFRKLFESDNLGRVIYVFFMVSVWLILGASLPAVIGKAGTRQSFHWTFVNGFMLLTIVYSLIAAWTNARRRQLVLIQQRTQAELDALKAQVNPHFLFNSLNNIYGTAILEDSPRTAESIQQLSGIVRYVMEESRLQTTNIQRELRFIDDFVELQRIRLPNQANIDIATRIDWDEKPAQIVPLLLNPLIENAFKYGISIQHPCFVHIHLQVKDGILQLTTENSVLPRTGLERGTGIGLANVRQRLALAYPDRHSLQVDEDQRVFRVALTINLY